MNNQDPNPEQSDKSMENLKYESINGDGITGGGKATVINADVTNSDTVVNLDENGAAVDGSFQAPSYEVDDVYQALGPDIHTK